MKLSFAAILLTGAAVGIACALQAQTKTQTKARAKPITLPIGRYHDFALAKDARSLSPKEPMNALFIKEGLGRPVKLLKTGDGFAQVRAASLNATLKVPLGWTAIENGDGLKLWTPKQETLITMQFLAAEPIAVKPGSAPKSNAFADARAFVTRIAAEVTRPGVSQTRAGFLADGSYAIEVLNAQADEGYPDAEKPVPRAVLQIVTPNPKNPRLPLLLSLSTPMKRFPRDLKLIGLIVRDRKVSF